VLATWSARRCYEGFNKYFACLSIPRGIWYAWKPAGGAFSAPQQLAAPALGQGVVLVTMNPAGDVVVGYEQRGAVFIRQAHTNGPFGAPIEVMSGTSRGSQTARLDYVGLDSQGELLVVTDRDGMLEARIAMPGRALGIAQVIMPQSGRSERPTICCSGAPVVAMGARGDVLIAWQEGYQGGQNQTQAVYRPAGGRFGPLQHLTGLQTSASSTDPEATVVNGQGHAVLALIGTGGPPPVVEISESNASGIMSVPSALGTNGHGGMGENLLSLADNAEGETALRYGETPPGQAIDGTPFTVDVRFSANGQPFGPAQALESGTVGCSAVAASARTTQLFPGCESVPTLVGAEEHAFYAVSAFQQELTYSTSNWVVNIQRLTQNGAGPAVELTLPTRTIPEAEPGPASLVDLGTSVQMDRHGRIHGHVTCGNHGEGSCAIAITIKQATSLNTVLAHTLVKIPAIEPHPLTLTVGRAAKRLLAHHHSIEAQIVTSTTSGEGPATQTEYPLTITAPKHSRRPKKLDG
jgi:hypothetical protein